MNILFWGIIGGMTLLTATLLWLPLSRLYLATDTPSPTDPLNSNDVNDTLNMAVYQDRLVELEDECRQDQLTASQQKSLEDELKRTLLLDIPPENRESGNSHLPNRGALMLMAGGIPICAVIFYLFFGFSGQLQDWFDAQNSVAIAVQKVLVGTDDFPIEAKENLVLFTRTLKREVKSKPEHATAWYLLGMLQKHMQDSSSAEQSLRQAYFLSSDPRVGLEYVKASMENNNGQLTDVHIGVLRTIAKNESMQENALSLLGFGAFNSKRYVEAEWAWKRLLTILDPASKRANIVRKTLEMIRSEQLEPKPEEK